MIYINKVALFFAFVVLFTAACGGDEAVEVQGDSNIVLGGYGLHHFDSCEDLDSYLASYTTDLIVRGFLYGMSRESDIAMGGGVEPALDVEESGSSDDGPGDPASIPPETFSETNIQELGVDEPDLVKTDGEYLYIAENALSSETVLHIVRSWPEEEAGEVSMLVLEGQGESLFLAGDTVIALTELNSDTYGWDDGVDIGGPTVVDEPKPEEPESGADGESTGPSTGEETSPPEPGSGEDSGDDGGDPDGEDVPTPLPEPDTPEEEEEGEEGEEDVPLPGEPGSEGLIPDEESGTGDDFSGTRIYYIDVSDPADPQVIGTIDVEGALVSGRMVGDFVYLALQSTTSVLSDSLFERLEMAGLDELDWLESEASVAEHLEEVESLLYAIILDHYGDGGREELLPNMRIDSGAEEEFLTCADVMRPARRSFLGVSTLLGFSVTEFERPEGTGLLADGNHLYGSEDALYLAQDSRWWWWDEEESEGLHTNIHKFELLAGDPSYIGSGQVDGLILNQFSMSQHEGHLRIATTLDDGGGWWGVVTGSSVVSSGSDDVAVGESSSSSGETSPPSTSGGSTGSSGDASSGSDGDGAPIEPEDEDGEGEDVPEPIDTDDDEEEEEIAEPIDPDDDDEEGVIIEVPVEEPIDDDLSAGEGCNVYVLSPSEDDLEVVGALEGLAPGEDIYAVRFVDEMGYVVTFEQTDPLFVIDLSSPTEPVLRGELEINGYSNYLHPFAGDYLIGIGQDADEFGSELGFHLQIFDVSDPTSPERIHHLTFESLWSYSEAQYDHHAFTFYAPYNLLAVPLGVYDSFDDGLSGMFYGIIIFEVSVESGFVEVGRVAHSDLARDYYCRGVESEECEDSAVFSAVMRRSVFIEDLFYGISNLGVTGSRLDALDDTVMTVPFFEED